MKKLAQSRTLIRPLDVAQLVIGYVGCDLHARTEDLGDLVVFPGDDWRQDVAIHTNCAMFVLGIWRKLGCPHPLLHALYVNEKALTWVLQIASDYDAVIARVGGSWPSLPMGTVLHYSHPGKPDDHVEFLLAEGENFSCDHAGAGRHDNAVTRGSGDWRFSVGRPVQCAIDSCKVINAPG